MFCLIPFHNPKAPAMMDELIESVQRAAKLTPQQAALAVGAVMRFFNARLPSALLGGLHAHLHQSAPVRGDDAGDGTGTA